MFLASNRDGQLKILCGPILLSEWYVVKALARREADLHLQIARQITNIIDATKDDWALDPDGAIGAACLALFPADTHTGAGEKQEQLQTVLPVLVRCR